MKKGHEFYKDDSFPELNNVASMTDCTGLIPAPVEDESEAKAYQKLQPITKQKPHR